MTLFALPYWLEWRLVVALIVGGFIFVIWKDKNLKAIPEFFKGAYERLRDMLIYRIEDREAYEANREQREADEAYKKALKEGKGGGKVGESEESKEKDQKAQNQDGDRPY